jgi:SEC-C motif domain protein
MININSNPCPCGSSINHINCCFDFLANKRTAKTAEQLMRSRYSAFCLNNSEYLMQTLMPSEHQANEKKLIEQSFKQSHWLGLKIIDSQDREIDQMDKTNSSWVEFVAFYTEKSPATPTKIQQLHERSNFTKIDNRWYYVDGTFLPAIKLNRNEHCFCGSNKKYKKCHWI